MRVYSKNNEGISFQEFIDSEVHDKQIYCEDEVMNWMNKYDLNYDSEVLKVAINYNISESYMFYDDLEDELGDMIEQHEIFEIEIEEEDIISESDYTGNGFWVIIER